MRVHRILDSVKEILDSVEGVGKTFTTLKPPRTTQELSSYLVDKRMNVWMVTVDGIDESFSLPDVGGPLRTAFLGYRIRVSAFVAEKKTEDSRKKIWEISERVLEKFLEERTLRDACLTRSPIVIESISEDRLGPHLVTRADFSFTAWTEKGGLEIK